MNNFTLISQLNMSEKQETYSEILPIISISKEDIEQGNVVAQILSNGKEVHITGDVDGAMEFLVEHEDDLGDFTPEQDRKLLWKIDLFLMPVMCLLYCFQFMDKLSNSYASLLGLRTDLHMVNSMYSWTGSAFYLGYLVFEFPAVRLLQRFPVAKTVACFIIVWGAILSLHSTPNYAGFVALRTILGMLELSVTPAFVIITGQYYRKEEVFFRTALWFSSNGMGSILGGSIAYGLVTHAHSYSIEAWKLVFIITGCLTVALGFLILFYIPDSPAQAWFLSEEDKKGVVLRIRANQQGFGNKSFKLYQFKEAFRDVNTWILFFFALSANIPNGGVTNFGSILLNQKLKYSVKNSLLLQMPGGAVELFGCPILAFIAQYFNTRLPMAAFAMTINLLATCLLAFAQNHKVQLAGYSMLLIAPLGFICVLSCVASNVAGHTKKTTVNAIVLVGYCVGNLIGPQTFLTLQAPNYTTALTCMVAFSTIALILLVVLYFSYKWHNKKKEGLDTTEFEKIANIEFADLTDGENPYFRYST